MRNGYVPAAGKVFWTDVPVNSKSGFESKSHSTVVIVVPIVGVDVDVKVAATPDCGGEGATVKDAVGAASADGAGNTRRATNAASTVVQQRECLDKGAGVQEGYVHLKV
jgi:hypothetical protein